jgi:hypothetical protein
VGTCIPREATDAEPGRKRANEVRRAIQLDRACADSIGVADPSEDHPAERLLIDMDDEVGVATRIVVAQLGLGAVDDEPIDLWRAGEIRSAR